MTTYNDGTINRRYQKIVDLIQKAGDNGQTARELEAQLEMNYHTLRKDCQTLETNGSIISSGIVRDRSIVYIIRGDANTPIIMVDKTPVEFTQFVELALGDALPRRSVAYTVLLAAVLTGLSARASLGKTGELDYYPKDLKLLLVDAINRAERFTKTAKSILDEPRFWRVDEIYKLANPEYDSEQLMLLTRELLAEVYHASNPGRESGD